VSHKRGEKRWRNPRDGVYRRHGAWERARRAFGPGDLSEQLTRLERCKLACPRMLLAAAIHHVLSGGTRGAQEVLRRYLSSFAPPAESLPADELEALESLERAMK
jgi:hypothetical protein